MYIETGNPISGKVSLSGISFQQSAVSSQLSVDSYQLQQLTEILISNHCPPITFITTINCRLSFVSK